LAIQGRSTCYGPFGALTEAAKEDERVVAKLDRSCQWPQSVQQCEKLAAHLFDFSRAAIFESLERAEKAESARPDERLKDDRQRVELARATE
jgi:hypothetical protein